MPQPSPAPRGASGAGASPSDAAVGRTVGRYRIAEAIGEGGMGVVYRAEDPDLGRDIALKVLPPHLHADDTARQRLVREARAAASLDHAHVATVHEVGESDDGRLYIAMAYYEGETLEARIDRGPLAPEAAMDLARQIASGLCAAHRARIVHRDVKPANVILVEDPEGVCAKVLDFGIAKGDDVGLTQTGESVGTALYMSPEQLKGEPVDARTDVWSLGAMLYEMLSGRRPFGGSYAAAVGYAVLHEEPAPLSQTLPDGLADVVATCLAKAPEARYATMEAFIAALDRVGTSGAKLSTLGSVPPGGQTRPPAAGVSARGLWRWVAVAAVVVALGAAAVALWPREVQAERLVVLPFRASGPDAEPLADGLVEAVTHKLSRLVPLRDRVRVVPASEVDDGMTPSDAHDRLGATLVVEGTVAVEGDVVRVSIGLVEVDSDGASQSETRQLDDASGQAFALQDAAALGVAEMLRVEIGADARDDLAVGGTEDPEANARYLRGRGVLRGQQSEDDLMQARRLFDEAIERDDAFALAYAGRAEAEWQLYRRTDDVAWADRALASGQRALSLDDNLPEVHVAMAVVYQGRGEYGEALRALELALDADPENSEVFRRQAKVYADMGNAPAAQRAFERAIELAPDYWRTYNSLGVFYLGEGENAKAEAEFRRALDLDPINLSLLLNIGVAAWQEGRVGVAADAWADVLRLDSTHAGAARNLSTARLYTRDFAGAVSAAEHAVSLQPDDYDAHAALAEALWWSPGGRERAAQEYEAAIRDGRQNLAVGRSPFVLMTLAHAFAATGRTDSARVYLDELERDLAPEAAHVQDAYVIGLAYEVAGERADALRWLQSAVSRGFGRAQIARSPWLSDLREDPLAATLTPTAP